MRSRFLRLFEAPGAGEAFDRLAGLYGEPHRRYHTLDHIAACLKALDAADGLSGGDRRRIELALWWHDAVYDPTRSDNEALSAELAVADLTMLGAAAESDETARLIRLTAGHTVDAADRIGAVLVSIDLSILGAPAEAYELYAGQIREEYAHVPDDLYRAGRAAVLRRFLDGPIFPDPAFADRLEAKARANMQAEIELLAQD